MLKVQFRVTQDQEHVELHGLWRHKRLEFGHHAHDYTLLLLARHRRAEQQEGYLDEASQGLMSGECLLRDLASSYSCLVAPLEIRA